MDIIITKEKHDCIGDSATKTIATIKLVGVDVDVDDVGQKMSTILDYDGVSDFLNSNQHN